MSSCFAQFGTCEVRLRQSALHDAYMIYVLQAIPILSICAAVGQTKSSSGGGRTNTSGCVYMRHLAGHNKHNNNSIILQFLATKHALCTMAPRPEAHTPRIVETLQSYNIIISLRRFVRSVPVTCTKKNVYTRAINIICTCDVMMWYGVKKKNCFRQILMDNK